MLHQSFVIIGTVISTIGSVMYLIDTIKGNVKPNRVSFLLWSIAPFIALAAQLKQEVGIQALMTFSTGFLPLTIFIASFVNRKAEWNVTRFDLICGALSIIGLMLWMITKVPNLAILFSIIADGLAAVPTIVKSYKYPETETMWPWVGTGVGATLTLLTLTEFNFANSAFLVYMIVVNLLIGFFVYSKLGTKKHETI